MQDNGVQTLSDHEAREALERFVMENDELLELEGRIGRFNIFDALGMVNAEIRHSNFLGWLLDPAESHGAGDLFLKAIVMDMLRETAEDLRPKGVSPIDLDGAQIASVDIRREWKNIDLLIHCESPRLVIAIENKVRSAEHSGQLSRYKQIVKEAFPDEPAMFVFLTREGDDPSDEDWTTYSYADVRRVLERVRAANQGAIGDDVGAFLDHYLHLIGSRLMEDPEIDRLCGLIYKNHRQALHILFERFGSASSVLAETARSLTEESAIWTVINTTSKRIDFIPTAWAQLIPAKCALPKQDPRFWVRFWLVTGLRSCSIYFEIGPCTDQDLRSSVVQACRAAIPAAAKKKGRPLKITEKWSRLWRSQVIRWDEEEPLSQEEFLPKVTKLLKQAEEIATSVEPSLKEALQKKNPRSSRGL